MTKRYDCDAVIIGAGISGLVCGCYLAKAGIKTMIVEKNSNPGGYCTSFKRRGFHFDACVHSLGSLREGGNLRVILNELDLEEKLRIDRYDPSDIIITPDHKISFWNDLDKTVGELQADFPQESENIKEFFEYVLNFKPLSSAGLLNKTFDDVLRKYFTSQELIAILSIPVLGNAGLPASKISAFPAVILYKEFIIDGGYYPRDGIQALPDALAEKFEESGGTILFRSTVDRMNVDGENIQGVTLQNGECITARYVVSNIDARKTFFQLLGEEHLDEGDVKTINDMVPSMSAFCIYIGLEKPLEMNKQVNLWYLPNYDVERNYSLLESGRLDHEDVYYLMFLHENTVSIFVNAPFINEDFWLNNKDIFTTKLIEKVKERFPDLLSDIAIKVAASPLTMYKQTFNYSGAAYGWASLPSQYLYANISKMNPFGNLFLTGHWTSLSFGASGVAFLGRNTAKSILNKHAN